MRVYALYDEENEAAGVLAYLEFYEEDRSFYFELPPGVDPWDLPFILHEFVQRGARTIGARWSMAWVRSRIVPPERQNLGEVLRENGLSEYDEMGFLELTAGRCAQDGCYLVLVDLSQLPSWYTERLQGRLLDACPLDGYRLLVVRRDNRASLCDLAESLAGRHQFARVLSDPEVYRRVVLQSGGHGVRWGSALQLSVEELDAVGVELPLGKGDLSTIMGQMICNTAEAAELLGCTRQNVNDLVRRGRLVPVKTGRHVTLFLRGDIWRYEKGTLPSWASAPLSSGLRLRKGETN